MSVAGRLLAGKSHDGVRIYEAVGIRGRDTNPSDGWHPSVREKTVL